MTCLPDLVIIGLTNNQFFWLNIDVIVIVIRVALMVEICSWHEG